MLPKENRLSKKKDFDNVFARAKTFKGDFLVVKLVENGLLASRFGFVVSKKVSTKAVARNKVKRRLRKIIEDVFVEIKKPVDVVFITLPGIQKLEFAKLQEVAENILKKIH